MTTLMDRLLEAESEVAARDRFIAAAITGLLANPSQQPTSPEVIALRAARIADAAMEQR